MSGNPERAVRRVAERLGRPDAAGVLGVAVSGSDLRSFLLDVARRRAAIGGPTAPLHQFRNDRFVEPGRVDARVLHQTIALVLAAIPDAFGMIELSPVAPLGTCSSVATVHQDKVVTTTRGTEVAADPTNALALVSASRRLGGDRGTLRLGAVQRVLRAQPQGAAGQAHFTVLGLTIAGRDPGNLGFERSALPEMLGVLVAAVHAVRELPIEIRITNLRDRYTESLIGEVRDAIPGAAVVADPGRKAGRGYYRDLCCKVYAGEGDDRIEVGDGGFTDWTRHLVGSRRERLLIAGLGLDRLAALGPG